MILNRLEKLLEPGSEAALLLTERTAHRTVPAHILRAQLALASAHRALADRLSDGEGRSYGPPGQVAPRRRRLPHETLRSRGTGRRRPEPILSRVERTSAELARLVNASHGATAPDRAGELDPDFTDAKARIARLEATGSSNKEIAAELGVSVRTVEGHISNVLSKKGWSNRVVIARHVIGRHPTD